MNSSFWPSNVGCKFFLRRKTPGKLENANVPLDNSVITNDRLPFKISSYNCSGLNCCSDYLRDILETCHYDFVWLQVTWLLEMNLNNLADIHKSYDYIGVS